MCVWVISYLLFLKFVNIFRNMFKYIFVVFWKYFLFHLYDDYIFQICILNHISWFVLELFFLGGFMSVLFVLLIFVFDLLYFHILIWCFIFLNFIYVSFYIFLSIFFFKLISQVRIFIFSKLFFFLFQLFKIYFQLYNLKNDFYFLMFYFLVSWYLL